ncbi:GLPGLI family protein [Marnyiella aurantia]|uniref:GLPGLI family protein n=3 Tax=Marnyiella aurantia TaxID=2758037 RepID=A0A7D7LLP4_9FLAO|nr:GLPGLI family protein [Marnyiella aurantia]QMS97784.1 GLPGLI family protein [Marnyiella aurantia]
MFVSVSVKAQMSEFSKIEVKYMTSFLRDTADVTSKRQEITVLRVGENKSIFKSEMKLVRDSLLNENEAQVKREVAMGQFTLRMPGNLPRVAFRPEVYRYGEKTTVYDQLSLDVYSFDAPNSLKWNITAEKKKIATYNCQKAVARYGNRDIIAWFTNEIPMDEGPYTFKGLPGLVVEVYDSKKHYHFSLISVRQWMKRMTPPLRNVIPATYEQFSKKRQEYRDDPTAYVSQNGIKVPAPTKELRDLARSNRQRDNNFLD